MLAYVVQIGDITAEIPEDVQLRDVEGTPEGTPNVVRCPDPDAATKMVELIRNVRKDQDSIGGVAEVVARGVDPGLGEPVFDKLKADLGKALFSIPAVVGVEFGAGFRAATMRGMEHNDIFSVRDDRVVTETNHHGGILGGISTGMPIVLRAALKPSSSLSQPQRTITSDLQETQVVTRGRHDPCLLPRFVPVAEAMVALVLVDHWLRQKAVA